MNQIPDPGPRGVHQWPVSVREAENIRTLRTNRLTTGNMPKSEQQAASTSAQLSCTKKNSSWIILCRTSLGCKTSLTEPRPEGVRFSRNTAPSPPQIDRSTSKPQNDWKGAVGTVQWRYRTNSPCSAQMVGSDDRK